jgi:hypothetical protein
MRLPKKGRGDRPVALCFEPMIEVFNPWLICLTGLAI